MYIYAHYVNIRQLRHSIFTAQWRIQIDESMMWFIFEYLQKEVDENRTSLVTKTYL